MVSGSHSFPYGALHMPGERDAQGDDSPLVGSASDLDLSTDQRRPLPDAAQTDDVGLAKSFSVIPFPLSVTIIASTPSSVARLICTRCAFAWRMMLVRSYWAMRKKAVAWRRRSAAGRRRH